MGKKGLRVALGTVSALTSGMMVHPVYTMKIRMQCQGELQKKPNEQQERQLDLIVFETFYVFLS